jgi:hypothetical protein
MLHIKINFVRNKVLNVKILQSWEYHKGTPSTSISNKQKCLSFFFYKIREQEGRTCPVGEESWYQWEVEGSRERGRRVNMVQILCTHVCKYKNDSC